MVEPISMLFAHCLFPKLSRRGISKDLSFPPFVQMPAVSQGNRYSQGNVNHREKTTVHLHSQRKTTKGNCTAKDADLISRTESALK